MKKNINLFIISYLIFLTISVISCDDGCGGNASKYTITDFDWQQKKIENTDQGYQDYTIENEVNFDEYGIFITPIKESYYASTFDFNIINKTYACSPVEPTTIDKITNIEIITNTNFDTTHLEGSNIVEYFDIASYLPDFNESNIEDFLNLNQNQLNHFILILKQAPLTVGEMSFTIKITLNANDSEVFEFTTSAITITNN